MLWMSASSLFCRELLWTHASAAETSSPDSQYSTIRRAGKPQRKTGHSPAALHPSAAIQLFWPWLQESSSPVFWRTSRSEFQASGVQECAASLGYLFINIFTGSRRNETSKDTRRTFRGTRRKKLKNAQTEEGHPLKWGLLFPLPQGSSTGSKVTPNESFTNTHSHTRAIGQLQWNLPSSSSLLRWWRMFLWLAETSFDSGQPNECQCLEPKPITFVTARSQLNSSTVHQGGADV